VSARSKARKRALDFLYEADIKKVQASDLFGAELAKSISTDESSSYINGVLGRIIKLKDSIAI